MTVYPKNSVLTATTPIPKYPIHWFLNAFSIQLDNQKRRKFHVGYCIHGKGIAYLDMENGIKSLIIHDVFADASNCEDGDCCLNLSCPANKVQIRHFKQFQIKNHAELEKLHRKLQKWGKMLKLDEFKTSDLYTATLFNEQGLKITVKTEPEQ